MNRKVLTLAVVALALAGCGDDKKSSDTTAVSAPETTAAPATTAAEATTTTVDEVAARVAAAEALAGAYSGEWNNTTFGSVGSIAATLAVDAATATATLTIDLGGNVFGAADPDPLTAEFDLTMEGPYTGTNELFGDFTITYENGQLMFDAPAVPGVGGRQMLLTGTFVDGTFSGTYTIVDLADGTFTATRT